MLGWLNESWKKKGTVQISYFTTGRDLANFSRMFRPKKLGEKIIEF